ncbi:MAG: DNA translocase FtsK 4TM domain-containing protein [bacterium]
MFKRKRNLKKFAKGKLASGKKIKDKKTTLRSETKKGIIGIVCFTLAIISCLSFFNGAGAFGEYLLKGSRLVFGKGIFLVPFSFALGGLAIFAPRLKLSGKAKPIYRTIFIGIVLFSISVLGVFHILAAGNDGENIGLSNFVNGKGGGYLGLVVGYPLVEYLGFWAGLVILFSALIISILIIFNIPLIPVKKEEDNEEKKPILSGEQLIKRDSLDGKKIGFWNKLKNRGKKQEEEQEQTSNREDHFLGKKAPLENKVVSAVSTLNGKDMMFKSKSSLSGSGFKLPPVEFLEKDEGKPKGGDIKANINIIKQTLDNFGIEVEMAEVSIGPTVTQYTLRPAQGVKLSKITALQSDLSLSLAAHPLRIEAPIPGRSLVGIEIPNKSAVIVRLRSLVERPAFRESSSGLIFALGRDVAGNPIFADLCQMPHLLVAGSTGTGKTIALNNLIISLLYNNFPDNLRFILIDPKRVELSSYESIPHLMTPVIVQPDKAVGALRWAVSEMERRFEVLQHSGRRDIGTYNSVIRQKKQSKNSVQDEKEILPYIVIIIDELADLMSSNGRDVEAAIVRLAQMARAVGIHLIVSTQRPSVEVITGLIKANITSRMAFQVASQIDSRTILDMAGAEKLLGNGDMLFLAGNSSKPRRIQGAFVSEKEVKKVSDYLRKAQEPEYQEEVSLSSPVRSQASFASGGGSGDDELCAEAQEIIIQAGKASASLLQRRLRVGYARAARLLDILEEKGIVGPSDGAKPRDVYIDKGENE